MEENMAGEFYARLSIYSSTLSPDEVNIILGIKCDKSQLKGDIQRPHAIVNIKRNAWFIFSQLPRDFSLEDQVKDLLGRISAVIDKIKTIADQPGNDVELGCIVHSKKESPINFTKETIAILFQMGASIDVDLYYFDRTWKVDTGLKSS
jgi:hypothetical protein